MKLKKGQIAGIAVVVGLAALAALAPWLGSDDTPRIWTSEPWGIMGTNTSLKVAATGAQGKAAGRALEDADAALRRVELLMSRHLNASEISQLNAAGAGEFVKLSGETLEVLRAAKEVYRQSGGAFDVTCLPIITAWVQADKNERLPGAAELAAARSKSSWDDIELRDDGAVKNKASVGVDLGGIAKGFGIDKAAEAMKKAGVAGGVVEVGGDVRCFGRPPEGEQWPVKVKSPFGEGMLGTLCLGDAGACTSGNYERYLVIEGERYSHIVDPRNGPRAYMALPASSTPASVTVVAPTATTADAWATALSVLGPDGLELLPKGAGIEAMVVIGGPKDYRFHMTEGFGRLFTAEREPPAATSLPAGEAAEAG